MRSTSDWLQMSDNEFLARYAPHAASRRGNLASPLQGSSPAPASTPGPSLGIAAGVGQAHQPQPFHPKFHSQEEYTNMAFDFKNLPPQIDRRLAIQTLMTSPETTEVIYNGRPVLVSEALRHMLQGDDAVVMSPAAPPALPGQLGHPGGGPGPNLTISQRAVDNLSPAQYEELKTTGHLQGLTNSDQGRALITVRNSSGTVHSRFTFNPETGAIEPGRALDFSDFDAPAGS